MTNDARRASARGRLQGGVELLRVEAASIAKALVTSSAFVVRGDGTDEDAAYAGADPRVVGAQEADAVGECEDPLSDGCVGQHAIDELGGGVDHAPGNA